jgi:hypothetical protein
MTIPAGYITPNTPRKVPPIRPISRVRAFSIFRSTVPPPAKVLDRCGRTASILCDRGYRTQSMWCTWYTISVVGAPVGRHFRIGVLSPAEDRHCGREKPRRDERPWNHCRGATRGTQGRKKCLVGADPRMAPFGCEHARGVRRPPPTPDWCRPAGLICVDLCRSLAQSCDSESSLTKGSR